MHLREQLKQSERSRALLIHADPKEAINHVRAHVEEVMMVFRQGNPDYVEVVVDSFAIEDSRFISEADLRKSEGNKKIFVIATDTIQVPAQSALLKTIEEPRGDSYFFLIVPPGQEIIAPLLSRFLVLRSEDFIYGDEESEFVSLPLSSKLSFIKKKSAIFEDDPPRRRKELLHFLRGVEHVLYKEGGVAKYADVFKAINLARETISSGSAIKNALEHVAISFPEGGFVTEKQSLW